MFTNLLLVSTISRALVLCAVIFGQVFLSTELFPPFIVLLGLLTMTFGNIQHSYLKLVKPLLVVLVIGVIGVFVHESRDVLRDVAYALMPIVLIYIGYWMAGNKGMWSLILKVMMILGVVLALIHVSAFIQNPELLDDNFAEIRRTAGGTGDLVALSLILGLFQRRFGINGPFLILFTRFIGIPILLTSFALSYSRTELMVVAILAVTQLGWKHQKNFRIVAAVVASVFFFFIIATITPEDETGTFRSKLIHSFTEVSISDYQDMMDINRNWRGFEAYKAAETFLSGNIQQQIFGQGFGALVDLGFYMPLGGYGETEFYYIPIIHNGYLYILIKTGMIGLICYIFFYINVIKYAVHYGHSINSEQRCLAHLLLGCVLSLLSAMYVVGGMSEMHDSELVLLLGYLMRRIRQFQAERSPTRIVRVG